MKIIEWSPDSAEQIPGDIWPYQLNQMKCQYYEQHFEQGVKDGFYPALPQKESGAKVSEDDDFSKEE